MSLYIHLFRWKDCEIYRNNSGALLQNALHKMEIYEKDRHYIIDDKIFY